MATESLILLVLLFPLLGGIINGTIGKNFSETVVGAIGTLMVAIPFIVSFTIFLSFKMTLIQLKTFVLFIT